MAITPSGPPSTLQVPFRRRRGFVGDAGQLVLHSPGFFVALRQGPHWGAAAIFILLLTALSAVQALSISGAPTAVDNWSAALVAITRLVLSWLVQAILLSEVTLFQGAAPRLGLNWRIAVWASLPLGLMAGVQLLYRSGGGVIEAPGVAGFLDSLPLYADAPEFLQLVMRSFASNFTLFWLWHLALLYLGGRHTLKGSPWSALLVVIMWVLIIVLLPVITNQV